MYNTILVPIDLSQVRSGVRTTKIAKDANIPKNVEIRKGPVATSILEAADSHEADLIIIASHRPGLADYFLGSTAARVVRHAQCPVLVDR